MRELTVIKIGGKVIDDEKALDRFLSDFAAIEGLKILVHGGGKIASDFGQRLGITPNYIDGRRITDADTLQLVTMVYGGLVNKNMVAQLQAKGVNAIGLTGADGNVLSAKKRPVRQIDYGFVGDVHVDDVQSSTLTKLLDASLVPVFCALTHDKTGHLLNTNADTIASVLASALSPQYKVKLVYCFEQKGVLSDFENQVVIEEMDRSSYADLKEKGVISEGMIPKLDNAFDALKAGATEVRIGHFSEVGALAMDRKGGTRINL